MSGDRLGIMQSVEPVLEFGDITDQSTSLQNVEPDFEFEPSGDDGWRDIDFTDVDTTLEVGPNHDDLNTDDIELF